VAKQRGLGRGIDALLQGTEEASRAGSVVQVSVDRVSPSPYQPRTSFPEESIAELADSIRSKGVLQPLLLERTKNEEYVIVAGERRLRAAKQAGLTEIPAIVRTFEEREKREIALVENIQREDLSPIDEALAYRDLMESTGLTQEEIAERLGKKRSTVANALRLLRLPEEVQTAVNDREVSSGHARALLSVRGEEGARALYERIRSDGISVREAERLAKLANQGVDVRNVELGPGTSHGGVPGEDAASLQGPERTGETGSDGAAAETDTQGESAKSGRARSREKGAPKEPELQEMEEALIDRLGTRVTIQGSSERGKIEIAYLGMEDLERIYEQITGSAPANR